MRKAQFDVIVIPGGGLGAPPHAIIARHIDAACRVQ